MHIHHVHGSLCLFLQMIQNVEYAKVHVNSELKVNMTTKKCTNAWTFTITSKVSLGYLQQTDTRSDSCKFQEKLQMTHSICIAFHRCKNSVNAQNDTWSAKLLDRKLQPLWISEMFEFFILIKLIQFVLKWKKKFNNHFIICFIYFKILIKCH